MDRMTEQRAIMAAWFAVYAMGGTFYTANKKVHEYAESVSPRLRASLATSYDDAKRRQAFVIDRPWADRGHAWRLGRLMRGGGQEDVSEWCATAREFWIAMRTVESVARVTKGLPRRA